VSRVRPIADVLHSVGAILLDFDGPVCAIFAGLPAPNIANQLRQVLMKAGAPIPPRVADLPDPLDVLRYAATIGDQALVAEVDDQLRAAELAAVSVAAPTPGAAQFLEAASEAGRAVAIVSNNSAPAVHTFLAIHNQTGYVRVVVGRAYAAPMRMKPDPAPVLDAMAQLGIEAVSCVLVGDSATDVHAAHAAGVACIGYANRPHKQRLLAEAGADAVVHTLGHLTAALSPASARRADDAGPEW
jgi:HAD superfamily hydrolase (TIGR01509 family)